jgi:C4-dicarboxylate-specific signal transduction histidine kinase
MRSFFREFTRVHRPRIRHTLWVSQYNESAAAARARYGEKGSRLSENNAKRSTPDLILKQLMDIARTAALAEMASGVAHELNQPLGAIATFSQAGNRMLDRPEPMVSRALDVFRQINSEALAAGEGIQRIRRLFQTDAPQCSRCQLPDLVAELLPVLEVLASSINAGVRVDAPSPVPDLLIDRTRIQHVLYALVQNAVDASASALDTASIRIDISADCYCVETGVADSGSGVPAELHSQLFRPFFTTKARGTGLGLASSRGIIESHEGTIGFESLPAGGSRFWFRLPIAETID